MVSAAMKLKKTLDPWKKTYDQLRQQIKKQRHYFATKVPSSQSYDFSSSHVWLWELDHRESWIPKDWYHPTISPSVIPFSSCLQSFPASVFSNESAFHIRWPKYWSFNISPSKEYSGLISFRTDWFDFLAVQGTLKSLIQHHSSKASILWCSAFFMV